ncbi:MAG: acyl-CoA dehydrogenase family protein, partial [Chloroflexi bacterium]|nr:acyl-CoA dehydrogenase family protein [Chloroflexota bacterium]
MTTSEARNQIVSLVREFVRRDIEPIANRYDSEDIYPHELIPKMREMGLFGITIPEKYGGMGLDYTTFAMIFEELSKGWMSVSGIIGTHHVMAYIVASFGTEEQKQRFLPKMATGEIRGGLGLTEPGAGSDVQNIQMTAVKDGEEYVLNGSKMFITNAETADIYAVFARTSQPSQGKQDISLFLVDKGEEGCRVGQVFEKRTVENSSLGELVFSGVKVSPQNLVGRLGYGAKYGVRMLNSGRITIAALATGLAQRALDEYLEVAIEGKKINNQHLIEFDRTKARIAELTVEIHAARNMTYHAAWMKESYDADPDKPHILRDYVIASNSAKLKASLAAQKACEY